jgi:integrase
MPLQLYRRKPGGIWNYRGTVAGNLLRGTTKTKDRATAARIISEIEHRTHKRHLDGPQEVLTFPQAVEIYLKSGKGSDFRSQAYITKLEDHWKNTKVKEMKAAAIRQSAIDLYPTCTGATWNRQVITPTQAIINHCADLELCPPIRIKRFKFQKKIKQPVTVEWLDIFCAHARPMIAAFATLMFATGCRFSEARRLEWQDVDFQQRTVLIRQTKNKLQRLPHMPSRLLVALANLPRDDKPFPWSESKIRTMWDEDIAKAAWAESGFVRLTCHSCRHGIATKLLRDGVDVVTAAGIAGMSVQVMISTYAHAMQKPQITERLFDTKNAHDDNGGEQKQQVGDK